MTITIRIHVWLATTTLTCPNHRQMRTTRATAGTERRGKTTTTTITGLETRQTCLEPQVCFFFLFFTNNYIELDYTMPVPCRRPLSLPPSFPPIPPQSTTTLKTPANCNTKKGPRGLEMAGLSLPLPPPVNVMTDKICQ